ncbi:MAG: cell division protein ZapA [Flavobacteriales bacterium]
MSEVSIKVVIAGRTYPLTVSSDQVDTIRKVEKQLEESISVFQQNYAVKDKQDLLAMAALQVASNQAGTTQTVVEKVVERVEVPTDISPELEALENKLNSFI